MKPLAFIALSAFCLAASCNNNPCKKVDCGTQGTCSDGICICNEGYEKDLDGTGLCEVKWSSKFLGNYTVSDTCHGAGGGGSFNYSGQITEVDEQSLAISDFNHFLIVINAEISASNPMQFTVADTNSAGIIFHGTGTLASSRQEITLNYVATYTDATKDTCTSIWTKQ